MSTSVYKQFEWTETRPHQFERGADEAEGFYHCLAKQWAGSGRMFFGMTGFASVSVSVERDSGAAEIGKHLEDALQRAWLALRHDHPNIASWMEYNADTQLLHKIYQTLYDEQSTESWLRDTFQIVRTPLSGTEWANDDPPAPSVPTLFVIATEDSSSQASRQVVKRDIVFRSPHEIIDGVGTMQLLGNLFAHAATAYNDHTSRTTINFGGEQINLTPPMRVAANIPPTLTGAQQQHLKETQTYNVSLSSALPIATLPYNKGAIAPGIHKRASLTLSKEATAALLAACKAAALTSTHAYHTAIALVLRDLQTQPHNPSSTPSTDSKVRYISYALINHRPTCVPPYNTAVHPTSVIHSVSGRSLVLDMPLKPASSATDEFLTTVSTVRSFYTAIKNDSSHLALAPSYFANATPSLPSSALLPASDPAYVALPIPAPDPNPSVSISSMGDISKIIASSYGPLQISTEEGSEPWVTGEELRTGLGVFLGTWRGRLTVSAAYNDAWHGEAEVREFLGRVDAVVRKGLGLEAENVQEGARSLREERPVGK
jgi:hypothetical protein